MGGRKTKRTMRVAAAALHKAPSLSRPATNSGPHLGSSLCSNISGAAKIPLPGAVVAGPARTCHQRKTPARSSRPVLHQPPATAATSTPFPHQVSPFRSEVLSSVAMSDRWMSRSAAPPSAIFFH